MSSQPLATTSEHSDDLRIVAEPGHCKADGIPRPLETYHCSGCWEQLPKQCYCGSSLYCSRCAPQFPVLATVPMHSQTSVQPDLQTVFREIRTMTDQTTRAFQDRAEQVSELFAGVGELVQEVREVRNDMVSQEMLQNLPLES